MRLSTTVKLILILAGVGVLYKVAQILMSKDKQNKKNEDISKQNKIRSPQTVKQCLYISEIKNLLEKYKLDPNEQASFFSLMDYIIKEGRVYAENAVREVLKSEEVLQLKAEKLLNKVKELKEENFKMNIEWGQIDSSSMKIYPDAVDHWAKEFNLLNNLKEEPVETMKKILDEKLFQYGIEIVLNRMKVRVESLEDNLKKGNIDRVSELLNDIEDILKNC